MTIAQRLTIALLLVLGLLGGLWSASRRVAVERANKTVALCVDDLEVRQLAALTGQTPEALLTQLKQAGATHVAISERTLGEMLQTGEVRVQRSKPQGLMGSPETIAAIAGRLGALGALPLPTMGMQMGLAVSPAVASMAKLGVMYDPASVNAARRAGLAVVARPMPDYLVTPELIFSSLAAAQRAGAKLVLFNGVSTAGGVKLAKETAGQLTALGLQYAFVELVPQEGAANLASALKYQIIRTHSISQEEMTKTSASRGLDRFTLGVTERGIRLCYVRLLLNPQSEIASANVAYLQSIRDALGKSGYACGDPQPFQPLSVPRPALALLALGVVGGGLWLLWEMLRPRDCWFWWLLGLGNVASAAMLAAGMAQAALPLLAAIIFPTLAVLFVASTAGAMNRATTGNPQSVLKGISLVVAAALITALGGFLIAGMLSALPYMMQIALFRGVKFAQLLPLLLVLGVMVGRTFGGSDASGWPLLRRGFTTAAEAFVKYWHAVAVFVVLGLVAFMIMRSGNESAVEVSGLELKLRALLDQILVVRPRTKEILFGFPALLLGLMLLLQGRPRSVWVWLTFGVIGLISMTNTFCHLHTPLGVSLLRAANGIWVGLLVGILWLAAKWVGERLLRLIWATG